MAFSKTDIANFALSKIGNSRLIENLDEATQEAMTCKLHMDLVIVKVLRDGDWPFTRAYEALQLVQERPNSDWLFAYGYPSDCKDFERIVGAARIDTVNYPFEIGRINGDTVIYSNQAKAVGVYKKCNSVICEYDQDFADVASWLLAVYVSMPLSSDRNIRAECMQGYQMAKSVANANSLNESQMPEQADSSFVTAREGY